MKTPWTQSITEIIKTLKSRQEGLTFAQAESRISQYGENSLPEPPKEGVLSALKDAFTDPLALVLTGAAILSAAIGFFNGEPQNIQQAVLIEGIVVFMALVGFYTDRQANNSLEKLKELQKTFARVYRDNKLVEIESSQLVPGDVIFLKEGDKVPADARVLSAVRAETNEAILTGESAPQEKTSDVIKDGPLSARTNMIYSGTHVEMGNITAIVTATGLETELGKIWGDLSSAEETQTPLQKQLDTLGKGLLWGTLVVCLLVVGIFIARGVHILEALIVAVSLAIAFIPEALGAVITIALALGVREMVGKKAIIKKLRAAEGLGSVSVICTDKTGTITEGQMKVTGTFGVFQKPLIMAAGLCNNISDAGEKALHNYVTEQGVSIPPLDKRQYEIPFSSERKMMSVVYSNVLYTKGAPEKILDRCTIKGFAKKSVLTAVQEYEDSGKRVLAFATKKLTSKKFNDDMEKDLTFLGLIVLSDPARAEVKETVRVLKRAGITPVMITGDSPRTALAIAKEVGILPQNATLNEVVTGTQLDEGILTPVGIVRTRVFARTTPKHKIEIVKAFQTQGMLVAMSGDGVNDAPSIKQADVGIAMASGTEITKETADVVLTGKYEAIAAAVEIGRVILQRTRLYTHALLSTNGAEVLIFLVAAILGWPVPLTAVQLLVINLLGDSWLSIALATEKAEKNIMDKPPRPASEPIITKYMYFSIAIQSIVTTAILAVAYLMARSYSDSVVLQQSVIFVTFMVQKVLRSAFTARSLSFNLWEIGFFSNKWSLIAALVTIGMTVVSLVIPFFGMTLIPSHLLLPIIGLGFIPPVTEEVVKLIKKAFNK